MKTKTFFAIVPLVLLSNLSFANSLHCSSADSIIEYGGRWGEPPRTFEVLTYNGDDLINATDGVHKGSITLSKKKVLQSSSTTTDYVAYATVTIGSKLLGEDFVICKDTAASSK